MSVGTGGGSRLQYSWQLWGHHLDGTPCFTLEELLLAEQTEGPAGLTLVLWNPTGHVQHTTFSQRCAAQQCPGV